MASAALTVIILAHAPPACYDYSSEKKAPPGACYVTGAYSGNVFVAFSPPEAIHNKQDNIHLVPLTHSNSTAAGVGLVATYSNITNKAPSTHKSTHEKSSNCRGSLRRPGKAAPTRRGTTAPASAPAAQWCSVDHPLAFMEHPLAFAEHPLAFTLRAFAERLSHRQTWAVLLSNQ